MATVSFEEKFALLKAEYASQLPKKLIEINDKWDELHREWKPETIVELHRHMHTLTGTSGTFGFNDISTLARSLEIILKPLAATNDQTCLSNQNLHSDINEKIQQLQSLTKAV